MIGTFIIGAIAGGAAMWFYGDRIRGYVDDATRGARARAADTLQTATEKMQSTKERIESGSGAGMTGSSGMTGTGMTGTGTSAKAIATRPENVVSTRFT